MAKRFDFYFRQPVTESELDGAFDALEVADRSIIADLGLTGVASGLVVTQASPTPNLTVSVSGGVAYDPTGERMYLPTAQPLTISVDSSNASTAVGSPGNAKVVSVFLAFARNLLDPRTDGNGGTVYFERDEAFTLVVRQGAEAPLNSEVAPALESDKILLADIKLIFGQTQVLNASINPYALNRRQDAYVVNGTLTTLREGQLKAFLTDFVTSFDTHKADTVGHGGPYNLGPGGRLTLSSTISATAADISGATSLYYLPHTSGRIALLGASDIWAWRDIGSSGISLALSGLVVDKIYDVYAYWTGSAVALELGAAWTNDTTPSDATALINGVLVKSADHTRRLLGCIRATGTTTTEDSKAKRYCHNIYNQVERPMAAVDVTDSWTYATTNTFRALDNLTSNAFEFITRSATATLNAESIVNGIGNGAVTILYFAGVGIDSQTVNGATINMPGEVKATGDVGPAFAKYRAAPGIGYHKAYCLEATNNAAGKIAGDNGLTAGLMQSGITGYILG